MPFRDAWLVLGVFVAIVGFAAAEPVIAAIGFVIMIVGGIARYWRNHLWDRVDFRFEPSERHVFIDEPVTLSIEFENRKLLPLPWYEWRLNVSEELEVEGEKLAAQAVPGFAALVRTGALGWYQKQEWRVTMRSQSRGLMRLGPTSLRSADLLGVFPSWHTIERQSSIIVFPRVYTLPQLGLPADRPFGDDRGRDRMFEDPLRLAGIREYRPGDAMRRIDWKATARHGDLRSRLYEPSATRQVYLMVNLDTLEHAWEGYLPEDLEMIVSVAASLAVWATAQRYSVGIVANGSFPLSDRPIRIPPSRASGQLTNILEALAVVQPLTLGDLAGAIAREGGRMPLGSTIVLVCALVPPPLIAAMHRLVEGGYHVAIIATSDRVPLDIIPGVTVERVGQTWAPEFATV